MKRGYVTRQTVAARTKLSEAEIAILVASGILQEGDGNEITEASLHRYLARRHGNIGAFAQAVAYHGSPAGDDSRLRVLASAAVTTSSEADGGDGGFLVPPGYADNILTPLFGGQSLLAAMHRVTLRGTNSWTIPVDLKPAHDQTQGIRVYREREGVALRQSKPKIQSITGKLNKYSVFLPVTEELLQDAQTLGAYLELAAVDALSYALVHDAIRGSGAGELLGAINAQALISVAAEGAQTTDTINGTNIAKMVSRFYTGSRRTGVALIHPDAEAQVIGATFNGANIYSLGDDTAPCGRLLGAPIVPHQAMSALGDLGDIMFFDPAHYLLMGRDPLVQTQTSLHLFFDFDLYCFKFVVRADGMPVWSAPVANRVGGNTQSPFVTLSAR